MMLTPKGNFIYRYRLRTACGAERTILIFNCFPCVCFVFDDDVGNQQCSNRVRRDCVDLLSMLHAAQYAAGCLHEMYVAVGDDVDG